MPFSSKAKSILAALTSLFIINSQAAVLAAAVPPKPTAGLKSSATNKNILRDQGRNAQTATPKQILIGLKPGVSQSQFDKLSKLSGDKTAASIKKLGVVKVTVPDGNIAQAIKEYKASGLVDYAEPNFKRKAAATVPDDSLYSEQWGLQKIGASEAWSKAGSNSVKVAVLDTGVDTTHEDLQGIYASDPKNPGRILGKHFYSDASGRQLSDDNIQDNAGHGTHITGIIAAASNNKKGIAGMAPIAKIMPVKILDDIGYGDDANIAQGLIWATDNGAKIINMSLAGPAQSRTLEEAIQYARDRGVVVVAATGNDASSNPNYPAAYEGVIGVGATDINDTWVHQSNYGNHVDVVAPGAAVLSTYPPSKAIGGELYEEHTGTSMAAGFVSGLAALILSTNPNLPSSRVEAQILVSADDLGAGGWDPYFGYGRINAAKALSIAVRGAAPSVTLESPRNGAIVSSGPVKVLAGISDSDSNVAFVDFLLNGQRVGSDSLPPYELSIPAAQFSGKNTIRVVAYDEDANLGFSNVTCYKQTFKDVAPGHWAFADIESLTAKQVLTGYPGGSFMPTRSVGRAEFLKMLMEGMGLAKKTYYSGYFKDVPISHWAWPYVEAAYEMGLVTGYGGSYFLPENRIKRVEMASALIKTGVFPIDYSGNSFNDVTPSYWGYVYVMSAKNAKVINGYPGNYFKPEQSMSRAEAARVIKGSFFNY